MLKGAEEITVTNLLVKALMDTSEHQRMPVDTSGYQ